MTTINSTIQWRDGMAFDARVEDFEFTVDADPQFGGRGLGPKPKPFLLTALIGCTAMDVIAILGKMRVAPSLFRVEADGDIREEHPKDYLSIQLRYVFEGDDLPLDRLRKAVTLSQERYCGVMATLRKAMPVDALLVVNGEILPLEADAA